MQNQEYKALLVKEIAQAMEDISNLGISLGKINGNHTNEMLYTLCQQTHAILELAINILADKTKFTHISIDEFRIFFHSTIHRYFVSNAFLATEAKLVEIIDGADNIVNNLTEKNRKRSLEIFNILEDNGLIETLCKDARDWLEYNKSSNPEPQFDDFMSKALESSTMSKKDKSQYRRFFNSLRTVRNKVSQTAPQPSY